MGEKKSMENKKPPLNTFQAPIYDLKCKICGKSFRAYRPDARYCDHNCSVRAQKTGRTARKKIETGKQIPSEDYPRHLVLEQMKKDWKNDKYGMHRDDFIKWAEWELKMGKYNLPPLKEKNKK